MRARPAGLMAALASLVLVASGLGAQSSPPSAPPPAPPGCGSPEYRQFDFWLGDWTVTDSAGGRVYGENLVTSEVGGCVLREQWTGGGSVPNTGQSLNAYDRGSRTWGQDWVGSGGDVLHLRGGVRNGAMVLEGEARGPDGTTRQQRITWTPQPDGRVRQRWDRSADGGENWTVSFDGWYRRKSGGNGVGDPQ